MEKTIAVITGAGSGLGAALARQLSRKGVYVCLLGRNNKKLVSVAKTLEGPYSLYVVDITSNQEVKAVIHTIIQEVGPIDYLFNNAGIGVFELAEKIEGEDIHAMIDTNLKGTIFCTQAVLPMMKHRNKGYIINIVSTAGKQGKVTESVYCASKFGVRGFTESLVLELKDTPIQAIGVYMGGMRTEFWEGIFTDEQTKHLMDPEDVAEIILENIKPRKYLTVEEVVIRNKISNYL